MKAKITIPEKQDPNTSTLSSYRSQGKPKLIHKSSDKAISNFSSLSFLS